MKRKLEAKINQTLEINPAQKIAEIAIVKGVEKDTTIGLIDTIAVQEIIRVIKIIIVGREEVDPEIERIGIIENIGVVINIAKVIKGKEVKRRSRREEGF